jgi:glycine cleavage system transcriptional repressor
MKKVIISVLGHDKPGILAATTQVLFEHNCNLENVSQTILQSEFAGVFIASMPKSLEIEELNSQLEKVLGNLNLYVFVRPIRLDVPIYDAPGSEPFVITTKGPDRKGLVAGITSIIADYSVNITNLSAVFKGGDDPNQNIMIYEVDIPWRIDQIAFEKDLRQKAKELELNISIQHRKIFETINRI